MLALSAVFNQIQGFFSSEVYSSNVTIYKLEIAENMLISSIQSQHK